MTDDRRPIGVFDSGVGGLTVLRALREQMPGVRYIYLGDTARVPYGTKSADTVRTYALRACDALVSRGVKALVVACNSASSVALPALRERWGTLPILGVIEPGARAIASSGAQRVLVLATERTVASGAYQRAIAAVSPRVKVDACAATLLVALAEEGWTDSPLVDQIVRELLGDALCAGAPDVVLLGCTHFPALRASIERVLAAHAGRPVPVIDSAGPCAVELRELLGSSGQSGIGDGGVATLVTDGPERFARVSGRFLAEPVDAGSIELIDLA